MGDAPSPFFVPFAGGEGPQEVKSYQIQESLAGGEGREGRGEEEKKEGGLNIGRGPWTVTAIRATPPANALENYPRRRTHVCNYSQNTPEGCTVRQVEETEERWQR